MIHIINRKLSFFNLHCEEIKKKVSYRVYRLIGNRRIPLPSCAYTAIRKEFPVVSEENYAGYDDESD